MRTKHRIALKARDAANHALLILKADEDVRQAFLLSSVDLECIRDVLDEYLGASTEPHRRECISDLFERRYLLKNMMRREGASAGIEVKD